MAKIPSRFYRPELDILRFLAFFSVFLSHALLGWPWFTTSFQFALQGGMCVFFLLSSYLITELLLKERKTTGAIHPQMFFARRILRIWPLYFLALVLTVVTGWKWPFAHVSKGCILAYLLLMGNWYNVLRAPMNSPWQPLWSINLEEQFYLLWPFLARGGRRYLWAVALLTFPLAAFTLVWWTGKLGGDGMRMQIWFNSLVQFQYFGLGAILALVLKGRTIQLTPTLRLAGAITAVLLFYTAAKLLVASHAQIALFLIAGYWFIGVASVILFLSLLGIQVAKLAQPFVKLGKISYGLYVFHNPCLFLIGIGLHKILLFQRHPRLLGVALLSLGLSGTILLASLSYRYYEAPFLRLKQRFELVPSRLI